MQHSRLIKLLKLLDAKEFQRLYKYLRSPFFNYSQPAIRFYEAIRRYHPTFESKALQPEIVWQKVHSDKPFQQQPFLRLSSNFAMLVKKYLAHLQLESEEEESQRLYIKALGKRNGYEMFKKETSEALAALEKQPYRDADYFNKKADLHFDFYFHPLTPKHTLEDDELTTLMDSIDKGFALSKFRIGSILKNRENLLKKKYPLLFFDVVEAESKNGLLKSNVLFQLYRLLFEINKLQKGHQSYFRLKKYFLENYEKIKRIDQVIVHSIMINYSVRQINLGDKSFYQDSLELYKFGLNHHLVMEKGKISEAVFGNIVMLGCSANELEWTEDFIDNHQQYLDEKIKLDTVIYSQATVFYFKKEFEETIHLLTQHRFSTYQQVKVRLLTIRSAFEVFTKKINYYDYLISQIEAFEKFLRRDDLQDVIKKEAGFNFTRFIRKLINCILENKKEIELKKLKKSILKENNLFLKSWLLEKVDHGDF